MAVRKYFFLFCVFLSHIPVLAQVDTAWVIRYNGSANGGDIARALTVDDSGNVYVTGYSGGSGTFEDWATIKYSSSTERVWERRYNGPENLDDDAFALAVDGSGNVYVTGRGGGDLTTLKYSSSGELLWESRYNGPRNLVDYARGLVLDKSGNVYVAGCSDCYPFDDSSDYLTIKYAPNGDTVWVRSYDGPANGDDGAAPIAVDDSGNIYVAGTSEGVGTGTDFATLKYSPTGELLWERRYNGPANSDDWVYDLKVDNLGNVYVTGLSYGQGTGSDCATLKYSSSGELLWERRYNGPANSGDVGHALALDDSNNVYIAGFTNYGVGKATFRDYLLLKYSSAGELLWERFYNGPGNFDDWATALAVDDSCNVYVTGTSGKEFDYDYATLKYLSTGELIWEMRYSGTGDDDDFPSSIALDLSSNVYVTGYSIGIGSGVDYATIKYVQFSSLCSAKPGDANADSNVNLADIIYAVNFVFKGGPEPNPLCLGDDNADGSVNLQDIIYEVNYIFKGGPAPQKSRECCL